MNTQSVVSWIFQRHTHTHTCIRINKNHITRTTATKNVNIIIHIYLSYACTQTHTGAPLPPYWIPHMNREKNAHKPHKHNRNIYLSISNTAFFSHEMYTQIPYLSVNFSSFFVLFSLPLLILSIFFGFCLLVFFYCFRSHCGYCCRFRYFLRIFAKINTNNNSNNNDARKKQQQSITKKRNCDRKFQWGSHQQQA